VQWLWHSIPVIIYVKVASRYDMQCIWTLQDSHQHGAGWYQDKEGNQPDEKPTNQASSTARNKKAKVDPIDKAIGNLLQQEPKDVASPQKDEDRGFCLSLYKDLAHSEVQQIWMSKCSWCTWCSPSCSIEIRRKTLIETVMTNSEIN